jgi:regulator of protease activity HflC (stomatin/prohibitin superfamily)
MRKHILSIGAGVILIFGALIGINSHYTVETGEAAIISKFGKISEVKYDGLHFKAPFITSKDIMIIRNTTYDFNKVEVSTKDMQTITLDLKMQVEINNPEIVYRNFRNNYVNAYIIPVAYENIQSVIAQYNIQDFVAKRQKVSNSMLVAMKDKFKENGFNIRSINIVNHDFSDAYEKAIERTKIAEQDKITAQKEYDKQLEIAKKKKEIAEALKEEKEIVIKTMEMEANTLNDKVLKKMFIEKWDGKLPSTMTDSDIVKMIK